MAEPKKNNTGPLPGLKVLDLTEERGLCTGKVLADTGADVVLIEKPSGSHAQSIGPFKGDIPDLEARLRNVEELDQDITAWTSQRTPHQVIY
jgi:crotonobetainyl-CoA:carnitine CoA-transferase CaiB-like acyl-CoA transferase